MYAKCICARLLLSSPSLPPPQRQFDVANTLEDQLLTNVRVEMEEPEGFKVVGCIPIDNLPYSKPGTTYTIVELVERDTGGVGRGAGLCCVCCWCVLMCDTRVCSTQYCISFNCLAPFVTLGPCITVSPQGGFMLRAVHVSHAACLKCTIQSSVPPHFFTILSVNVLYLHYTCVSCMPLYT